MSLLDRTTDAFWLEREATLVLQPEVDEAAGRVRFRTDIALADATLRLNFRLDTRKQSLEELFRTWDAPEEVSLSWTDEAVYLEGLEAKEVPVPSGQFLSVLKDPKIRTICGLQKVVVPIKMALRGNEYAGTMTVGLAFVTTTEPVNSDAANIECEEYWPWYNPLWTYCSADPCAFLMPADPRLVTTCTAGGVIGGVTATGTAIVGIGGAELGVEATTRAECWNEFTGTCKFVDGWFSDYCVCSPKSAPTLRCNNQPAPCQGTAGGTCRNPTWSCGPSQPSVDAGVASPVPPVQETFIDWYPVGG